MNLNFFDKKDDKHKSKMYSWQYSKHKLLQTKFKKKVWKKKDFAPKNLGAQWKKLKAWPKFYRPRARRLVLNDSLLHVACLWMCCASGGCNKDLQY